ncbi:hypothetical protein HQ576_06755 [bacterium]|nr:hypothetical protein [bacterium]
MLNAVLTHFRAVAARWPDEPERYLPLVKILHVTGRFAAMLGACDEIARQTEAARVVHLHIAQAYLHHEEWRGAIALLEHATQLQPKWLKAHARLGSAYRRAKRYDDALRAYETAERLAADAPAELRKHLQVEMARILACRGDAAGASARYEAALGLGSADGQRIDLAKGLIVHYRFDRDASDASGRGHHGENHGAMPDASGRIGGALAFDGTDDYVSIPARATQGLESATFSLWVKTASEPKRGKLFWAHPTLLGTATNGWGSGDLGLMLNRGRVAYFHGLTPDGRDLSWSSAVAVNDGEWHHVALVNGGPFVLLYVDGRLISGEAASHGDGTVPLGAASDTPSGGKVGRAPFFVGACNAAMERQRAALFCRSLIDDVRIWNRALSAREIASICAEAR